MGNTTFKNIPTTIRLSCKSASTSQIHRCFADVKLQVQWLLTCVQNNMHAGTNKKGGKKAAPLGVITGASVPRSSPRLLLKKQHAYD